MSNSAIDTNALKWIGSAGKTVGKFIGRIPVAKEAPIDEFLQDSGAKLQRNAAEIEKKAVNSFAAISDHGTVVFIEKMDDMNRIYNHTSQICYDESKIYLVVQ